MDYEEPIIRHQPSRKWATRKTLSFGGRRQSREFQERKKDQKRKTKEMKRERRTIYIIPKKRYDGENFTNDEQMYCHGRWSECIPINGSDYEYWFWESFFGGMMTFKYYSKQTFHPSKKIPDRLPKLPNLLRKFQIG
jgi:hypothetical protein